MSELADKFFSLSQEERKAVKITACRCAYSKWLALASETKVDQEHPFKAIEAIENTIPDTEILERYRKVISEMKSGKLDFGEDGNLMYYSISNFYEQEFHSLEVGDWTIINQALADLTKTEFALELTELIKKGQNA